MLVIAPLGQFFVHVFSHFGRVLFHHLKSAKQRFLELYDLLTRTFFLLLDFVSDLDQVIIVALDSLNDLLK